MEINNPPQADRNTAQPETGAASAGSKTHDAPVSAAASAEAAALVDIALRRGDRQVVLDPDGSRTRIVSPFEGSTSRALITMQSLEAAERWKAANGGKIAADTREAKQPAAGATPTDSKVNAL